VVVNTREAEEVKEKKSIEKKQEGFTNIKSNRK
jgi:hypothetical protein